MVSAPSTKSDPFCRTYQRHGHSDLARTLADGRVILRPSLNAITQLRRCAVLDSRSVDDKLVSCSFMQTCKQVVKTSVLKGGHCTSPGSFQNMFLNHSNLKSFPSAQKEPWGPPPHRSGQKPQVMGNVSACGRQRLFVLFPLLNHWLPEGHWDLRSQEPSLGPKPLAQHPLGHFNTSQISTKR